MKRSDLAEEAFTAELAKLVSHLTERLSGQEDGRQKIFRDSAIENLTEFFGRFRELNVRSSEQLDQLVGQAQRVIRGVEPQDLRDNARLRQHVATEMSRVQSVLDGMLVDRPRRNILRRAEIEGLMQIIIEPGGVARCIYTEEINLAAIGSPTITRASHVEPDQQGRWLADMSPVGGKLLGPFNHGARLWRRSKPGWKRTGLSLQHSRLAGTFTLPAKQPAKCHAVSSKDAIRPIG